jgi:hypothetical protein
MEVPITKTMTKTKANKKVSLPEKYNKLVIFEFWMMNQMVEPNLCGLVNRYAQPMEDQMAYYRKYEEDYKEETKKYKNYMQEMSGEKVSKVSKVSKESKVSKVSETAACIESESLVEKLTKCALNIVEDTIKVKEKIVKEKVKVVKEKVKVVKEKVKVVKVGVELVKDVTTDDDDDEIIETTEIIIDGTLYLKALDDRIYDRDTQHFIGTHNLFSNTITH